MDGKVQKVAELVAAFESALSNVDRANELSSLTAEFNQVLTHKNLRDYIRLNIEALNIIGKELEKAVEDVR